MKRAVYKYKLELTWHEQAIVMPIGATILHVESQAEKPCMWVEVNPDAQPNTRFFTIYNTGDTISDYGMKYVGTFMLNDGAYVGHIYEREI